MRTRILATFTGLMLACSASLDAHDAWTDATQAFDAYDHIKALPALRTAASAGHTRSQLTLALMLWNGEALYPGVPIDRSEALDWFGKAAPRKTTSRSTCSMPGRDAETAMRHGFWLRCIADSLTRLSSGEQRRLLHHVGRLLADHANRSTRIYRMGRMARASRGFRWFAASALAATSRSPAQVRCRVGRLNSLIASRGLLAARRHGRR